MLQSNMRFFCHVKTIFRNADSSPYMHTQFPAMVGVGATSHVRPPSGDHAASPKRHARGGPSHTGLSNESMKAARVDAEVQKMRPDMPKNGATLTIALYEQLHRTMKQ